MHFINQNETTNFSIDELRDRHGNSFFELYQRYRDDTLWVTHEQLTELYNLIGRVLHQNTLK